MPKNYKRLLTALLTLLVCIAVRALFLHLSAAAAAAKSADDVFAPAVARRLSAEIKNIVKQNNLPSVALEVSIPGKKPYTFVAGFADLPARTPRTLSQPFRIASVTKPFAATAVLILIDEGLLHKGDQIAKWYPDFPNAGEITVDDLLRMRSGIPAPNDDEVLARVYDAPLKPAPPLEDELKSLTSLRSAFKPPNQQGVYTDFNYDILAGIVQRVTGNDMGALITRRVLDPLKLRDTSWPIGVEIPGPLRGYGWDPATHQFDDKTLFNPPLAGAAGALVSTIPDLRTFSRTLCRGGLLNPDTQRERLEGQPLVGTNADYGEGVAVGHGFCGHSGTINGFSTDMYYVQQFDASLVISVNRLDRNNKSQSSPVLALVGKAILSELKSE